MEFYIKVILRIVHVLSASLVIGGAITDFVWGLRDSKSYIRMQIVCGILLLVTGLINMVLLRTKTTMGSLSRPWSILFHIKLCLWLLLLPIPEFIARKLGMGFSRVYFNVPLVSVILVISSFMKQYRDWAVPQHLIKNS